MQLIYKWHHILLYHLYIKFPYKGDDPTLLPLVGPIEDTKYGSLPRCSIEDRFVFL